MKELAAQYAKGIAAALMAIVGLLAEFWPAVETIANPDLIQSVAFIGATILVVLIPNKPPGGAS